jgi:hypothetical protein
MLGFNDIGDEGANLLATGLPRLTTLIASKAD